MAIAVSLKLHPQPPFTTGTLMCKNLVFALIPLAPVLYNIFMTFFDKRLEKDLSKHHVLHVFRYINDFLVILDNSFNSELDSVITILLKSTPLRSRL